MNFKKFGVSKNVMPSAVAETKELNGITVTCDGKGTYTISGTASEYASIVFDIPEFTTPISIGRGGNGTLSFFNTFDTNKTQITFYYNSTRVDDWVCTPLNRTNTIYSTIGNKTINKITFNISGGTSVQGTVSPMFTNDGQLPAEFEPHMMWHDTPHYVHNTSTDTLTTLPAVLYPNDTTATVGLKGQMEQSGTPTPTTPIQPSECGERTGNLCIGYTTPNSQFNIYIENLKTIVDTVRNFTLSFDSEITYAGNTLYLITDGGNIVIGYVAGKGHVVKSFSFNSTQVVEAIKSSTNPYIRLYVNGADMSGNTNVMLNEGSTPLPYEPYGVKIPILSNSTTTPVYFGEVETVRNVKKLVLTGGESYVKDGNATYLYYVYVSHMYHTNCLCSHLKSTTGYPTTQEGCSTYNNAAIIYLNFGSTVMDAQTSGNTVAGLKEYLAAQYAAGTPVTIWYVLATPTTAVVNEPIRKIGDYADEVSGITIPTIAGANTISIGTTVQPSEVTATYKGWHPVADVHERENGQWD